MRRLILMSLLLSGCAAPFLPLPTEQTNALPTVERKPGYRIASQSLEGPATLYVYER